MKRCFKYFATVAIILAPISQVLSSVTGMDTIVVVVHKDNSMEDISAATLRKIYLGKITIFPNGKRVVLGEVDKSSETFYRILMNKTPMNIRKYWISVVFSGGMATPPVELKKSEEIREFIQNNPGAILFSTPAVVDSSMKILTIDGKSPGEPGYLLNPSLDQE
jgi:ABC-type phosphate transport system substrate-binding protein